MKRTFKNAVMIGMAAVLIGTSAVTISYASKCEAPQFSTMQEQRSPQQNGNPLEDFENGMPERSGDFDGQKQFGGNQQPQAPNDNQQSDGNQQPQAPNGNQQSDGNQQPQAPNGNQQSDGNQQPQAPNGNQQSDSNRQQNDSAQQNGSASQQGTSFTGTALSAESSDSTNTAKMQPGGFTHKRGAGVISALCYSFAAVQIAIILAIILYLILSKFNRLSLNAVAANMKSSQ